MPVEHPELLTCGAAVPVEVRPAPSEAEWGALVAVSGASAEAAAELARRDDALRETLGWWSAMPCVNAITEHAGGLGGLTVWESDYAFASALRQARPEGGGLPLYGGPLGLALLPVCRDGLVMARRSSSLHWAPGRLRLPTEGVLMEDLSGPGASRAIDVVALAWRLMEEELGSASASATVVPVGFYPAPARLAFVAVAHLDCTVEDLVESVGSAPDGFEHTFEPFGSAAEALAALGEDRAHASARLLEYVARGQRT